LPTPLGVDSLKIIVPGWLKTALDKESMVVSALSQNATSEQCRFYVGLGQIDTRDEQEQDMLTPAASYGEAEGGSRRCFIILVVLCSGLCGTPAESIILEPVSKLSKQTWSAKPSVPQPKSTLEQALPDTWPDPYRGVPAAGHHVSPGRHLSPLGHPASG
jgi:hypothetical protein